MRRKTRANNRQSARPVREALRKVYEGKSKILYETEGGLMMKFKDEMSAFDGRRVEVVKGKGKICKEFTCLLMRYLESKGIKTHLLECLGDGILVKRANPIPLEFIVRNVAWGSLLKRLPLFRKGERLKRPIFEVHYKSDELHDPLLANDDPLAANLLTEEELKKIRDTTMKVNSYLSELFSKAGFELMDFKVEYGRVDGEIILIDELSPDVFRVRDSRGNQYDKDLFRRGLSAQETLRKYEELLESLKVVLNEG